MFLAAALSAVLGFQLLAAAEDGATGSPNESGTAVEQRLGQAACALLRTELERTEALLVSERNSKLVPWVLTVAALAVVAYLLAKLDGERRLVEKAREEQQNMCKDIELLESQKEECLSNSEKLQEEKEELEKLLECTQKENVELEQHAKKIDKDKCQLVETLEIHSVEIGRLKASLVEAEGWQKECLKMDEEVNRLYQAVDAKDIESAKMQELIAEAKDWMVERVAMQNKYNDLVETLHDLRAEVKNLKLSLLKSKDSESENERLKMEMKTLHQALTASSEKVAKHKKIAMMWHARALESTQTLNGLMDKAKQGERLKMSLEACIAEGKWANDALKNSRMSNKQLDSEFPLPGKELGFQKRTTVSHPEFG